MADPIVPALALAIEALAGWPRSLHACIGHPVGLAAKLISITESRFNRPGLPRRALGVVAQVLLISSAAGLGLMLETLLRSPLVVAFVAWPTLAARSLDDHVRPIAAALYRSDLPAARTELGKIVGRDTHDLADAGISGAALESLAESLCDGVVAPLFWLVIGGLPAAFAYKAANTADSLIGHHEDPYRDYGWAAAHFDDLVNLIPARLCAMLICAVAPGGWHVLWRDHARHASPNAGWPESAMAGALGVRLAGPARYDGVVYDKPWIGNGRDPCVIDLARGLRIYRRAWAALGVIVLGGAIWFR